MEILENLGRRVIEKRGAQGIRAAAKEIGLSHATLRALNADFFPISRTTRRSANGLG